MSKTRAQKEVQLNTLTDYFSRAKAVVFADYQGLTMKQLSDLRNSLSEQNAQFVITKNTITEIALKQAGKEVVSLDGPTATLFAYDDEVSPLKTLVKAFKDYEKGKVKGGFLGDNVLDGVAAQKLATLPSKDELRGKTVSVLVAPLRGIVGVLQANLRNLVYALSEIQKSKGGV